MLKVQPISIEGVMAPAIYVDAANDNAAISEARSKSGLGRFQSWNFKVSKQDYQCKSEKINKRKFINHD